MRALHLVEKVRPVAAVIDDVELATTRCKGADVRRVGREQV